MPFINTKINRKITQEQKKSIKSRLGQAMSFIGKSESWLMLSFDEEKDIYFKGSDEHAAAFVEVQLFGKATDSQYDDMTREVTAIIQEELSISPDHIYVKYEEVSHWGYNGVNF